MSWKLRFVIVLPLLVGAGCQSPPPATADITIAPIAAPTATGFEPEAPPEHAYTLRFVPVDDQADPFIALSDPSAIPEGVLIERELVSLGDGTSKERRYARVSPVHGDGIDVALARMRPFFAGIALPAGETFAFQRLSEFDRDDGHRRDTGYRTYVLGPVPIVTERDVKSATAQAPDDQMPSWSVSLELTPSGSERFRVFTRDHIGRRMAVVANGFVMSAPVIRSEIGGGRASITVGGGTVDESAEIARALAKALVRH